MKKIIASVVAFAAVAGLAFADVKVNFYNKLYSEDPFLVHDEKDDGSGDYETNGYFPGINERMYADIVTDKVDAGVKTTFSFFQDDSTDHFGFSGAKINDWWVEFRPFDIVTFGLHDDIWADGSYLPIWDDNVSGGNIGSNGFTAVLRPVEGLRIGATIPGVLEWITGVKPDANWLNGDNADGEHDSFHFGLGAIFDAEAFQAGVTLQNIPCGDDRQLGGYINLPGLFGAVEELTIGAGFTHSWGYNGLAGLIGDYGIAYENLLNVYAAYETDSFGITAEAAFNFGDDDIQGVNSDDEAFGHDFYTAVAVSFGLADKLTATATGKLLLDLTEESKGGWDTGLGAAFELEYELNEKNTLNAGVEFNKIGDYWDFAIPVGWKYTLQY